MSKKYKLCKILICTIISMTIYINLNVNTEKCYAQDYDFSDVQGVLDDSEENINFKETVTDIASGESDTILRTMLTSLKDKLFHEFTYNKIAIAEIIALAIAADSVKISAFQKVASAIPGVGGGVNAVTGVIAGSANIIKNAIGAAALIGIIVCCFVPLAKIAAFSLMYQGTAAIVQPVADKRIVECIGGVAAGSRLLLKMVFISAVLFVITIAIVCLTVR